MQDKQKKARWSRDQKLAAKRGQAKTPGARETRRAAQFGETDQRGAARTSGARHDGRGADRGGEGRSPRGGYREQGDRSYGDRPDRGERRSYGDRPQRSYGDRPSGNRSYGERSYGDRPSGNRSSGDRPYGNRDDRRSYGQRDRFERDERRPYGGREGNSYGDRDDRRSYGDRPSGERRYGRDDRRSYGERDDRRPYGGRDDRRPYGDRGDRSYGDRDERPRFDRDRGERRFDSGDRRGGRREFGRDDRFERRGGQDRRGGFERRGGYDSRPPRDEHADVNPDLDVETYVEHTPVVREQVQTGPIDMAENGFAQLGVPESLVERLGRDGITAPFPIQTATIPDALAGRDVLGRGRTGSGKTLSFGLPMLTRLSAGSPAQPNKPRAIVLVPTRELAMQVSDALQPLVHVIGLHHKLVAGGMPYEPQLSALARGVDVLIATPGRLKDLIDRGAADLSAVEVTVLDEADHMAEMGFLEAITEILDLIPGEGQRLLFSATLDRGIDTIVQRYLTDPVEHATDDGTATVTTMEHHALLIEPRDKKAVTAEVANREGRTVVFARTKLGADRIAGELRDLGVMAASLHGGLTQSQRNKVLGAFRDGRLPVLVATDVAARGIHVDDVGVVLQVDPPADHKDYLHRAGRTARAGEQGTVVSIVLPHQRRTMQRMLDEAGVGIELKRAQPGDEVIREAGGSTPEGNPLSDDDLYAVLNPQRRGGRGGGPRGGGQRGGYGGRGRYDGPRERRGSDRGGDRRPWDRDDRGRGGYGRDDRGGRGGFRDDRPSRGGYRDDRGAHQGGDRRRNWDR